MLWGFISRYVPGASPETAPILDALVGHALTYYRDRVKPAKAYRAPLPEERAAIDDLRAVLAAMPADADAEAIQTEVYEVGKRHPFESLRDWFRALYEILLGQSQGPAHRLLHRPLRTGKETVALIDRALAGEDHGGVASRLSRRLR